MTASSEFQLILLYSSSTIVACIGVQEHDDSWQQSFTTFPFGPCQLVVKPDS